MKILMDSDCLIKITKAGLKETVCDNFSVAIPSIVEKEVVREGIKKECADAFAVKENIIAKRLKIVTDKKNVYKNGDNAVIGHYHSKKYDTIATDDAKLIRRLKSLGIPFLLPGLIIHWLNKRGLINKEESSRSLERLRPFISNDEYSVVRLLLEEKK